MVADKYVSINGSGDLVEVPGTTTSAGAGNAGNIVALNAYGQVDSTMLPGSSSISMTASENIAAGALINIHNSSGVKVRNADAATGKAANGYVNAAILSGATGPVFIGNGANSGVTGLTVAGAYFLGNAGAVTTTAPTATGSIRQKVGVARTTTELEVILYEPITRA